MTHFEPKRCASGAHTLPGVLHEATFGRASLPWVQVARSWLTSVWTFIPLPFVPIATQPSPSGKICGAGKLLGQTGVVAVCVDGVAGVAGVVTVPPEGVSGPPPQPARSAAARARARMAGAGRLRLILPPGRPASSRRRTGGG